MTVAGAELIRGTVRVLGVAVVPHLLSPGEVDDLLWALGEVTDAGLRGVLRIPAVSRLARSAPVLKLVQPLVPGNPRPVRAIYFERRVRNPSLRQTRPE